MTNPQRNLNVVTRHLDDLARKHGQAADQLIGANREAAPAAASVLHTHGLVCAATSAAMSSADDARNDLGARLFQKSTELSAKLTTAAANYRNTDYLTGKQVGRQCRL